MGLIVLLILVVITAGFWLRRRRRQRVLRRLTLRQLRTWLGADAARAGELPQWVSQLSPEEAEVLLELVHGYLASLNWQLNWLFSPHLHKSPQLQQALEEGVLAYMRSLLTSLQLVDDVRSYTTYVDLLRKPAGRRQSALIQQLHTVLAAQQIVEPLPKKRGWGRGKARRKQQIAAVFDAFEREPAAAMAALKGLLAGQAAVDVQKMVSRAPASAPTADLAGATA